MNTTDVNDFVVKKVPVPDLPSIETIAGNKLFPQLYLNAFLCAKKCPHNICRGIFRK